MALLSKNPWQTEVIVKIPDMETVGIFLMLGLMACGGGGSSASKTGTTTTPSTTWDYTTGANSSDLITGTTFNYTVSINLDTLSISSSSTTLAVGTTASGSTPLTIGGSTVITVTQDAYGFTIDSDMPNGSYVAFELSGSYSGSITIYSAETFKLSLNGATITSTDGPAINIQSNQRAFVVLNAGTTNTLSDCSTWSTRYLEDSTEMDLKGTIFSEGPLLFSGSGSLGITANKKHALCSDGHIRLTEGSITIQSNKKDGIRTNNAFIMDGGSLAITTASGAGKGIKVEGKEDTSTPLGFVVINDGTLNIKSYDKAITASWEAEDDATTTTTADDPDPFVIINGGTITINTFGTPYEDPTGEDSLSPEGIESKSNLTIAGGTLDITTTDDGLNAGKSITINGGSIYVNSSVCDAVDSNGTLSITGGVLVAIGASAPEGGLDSDNSGFTISGGTFIGMGGSNSTPTSCTQNTLVMGSGSASLMIVKDSSNKVAFAFQVPSACTAQLCSTADLKTGSTYTVYSGGTVSGATSTFHGLYLGLDSASYTGGTATSSAFTISSTLTNVSSK